MAGWHNEEFYRNRATHLGKGTVGKVHWIMSGAGGRYALRLPRLAMDTTDLRNSKAIPNANVSRVGEKLIIKLQGDWTVRYGENRQIKRVFSELDRQPGASELEFDMADVASWDTSLLIIVTRVEEWCKGHNVGFGRSSLPLGVKSLIALSEEVPERKTGRSEKKSASLFAVVGRATVSGVSGVNSALGFIGETVLSFGRIIGGRAAFDWRLFWLTMEECSAQALPIVGMISFLTGLIFGFVGAVQLRQFGAGIYVANLVAVAMAREMGAIMTGIIMAGRTGAAFAAQIGSMKVSEEIDALRTLAISPMDFLVSPRLFALSLMMPLLVLYSDLVGILGGAVVGLGFLDISWTQYWNQTTGSMGLVDIATGLIKSAVFGVIVAMAGCERGMQCGNNAAAVGNAATSAVVLGITFIVASDAAIDVIQEVLKF
jgi:phospholipid/cholesterol/gamma-HCH transport system permease protein